MSLRSIDATNAPLVKLTYTVGKDYSSTSLKLGAAGGVTDPIFSNGPAGGIVGFTLNQDSFPIGTTLYAHLTGYMYGRLFGSQDSCEITKQWKLLSNSDGKWFTVGGSGGTPQNPGLPQVITVGHNVSEHIEAVRYCMATSNGSKTRRSTMSVRSPAIIAITEIRTLLPDGLSYLMSYPPPDSTPPQTTRHLTRELRGAHGWTVR